MPKTESTAPRHGIQLAERMRNVVGAFVRTVRAHTHTLKTARTDTLDFLAREGALSVAELAQRRNVKHQSMRLIVLQLEHDGMLKKKAKPGARRSQLLELTAAGRASVIRDRKARYAWIDRALRQTLTQRELQCLAVSLDAIQRLVEENSVGYPV